MGQRMIGTWTQGDVLDYMTWRRTTGRLEVTIRKDIQAGRQLARFALAHGWLNNDPFVGVEVPSDRDSLNELVLTREEVDAYLERADRHHSLGDLARAASQTRPESGGRSRGFVLPQLLAVVRGLQPQPVGGGRPSPGLQ